MIDLNKFNKPKKIIVPILNHSFRYNGKRYNNVLVDNGWYEVIIAGNNCKVISNIVIFQVIDAKTITGYVYEDNIIFSNFDVGKRKINQEVMTKVYFNTSPEFTSIEAVIWEDGLLYYIQPNYNDYKIFEVKSALDYNGNISNIKGITPELKTLTLFVDLRQQKIEELKRIKDQQELAKTIQGRLYLSFQRVGAELIDYKVINNRIIVNWSIRTQEFNSVLDKKTFRVIEAGYCMSGHDKEHSLHSMAVLAKEYDKDGLIYKTRE